MYLYIFVLQYYFRKSEELHLLENTFCIDFNIWQSHIKQSKSSQHLSNTLFQNQATLWILLNTKSPSSTWHLPLFVSEKIAFDLKYLIFLENI